jgi:hypothetical protein
VKRIEAKQARTERRGREIIYNEQEGKGKDQRANAPGINSSYERVNTQRTQK